MLEEIVSQAPLFLLVAVRCFGMILTLPLFSSRAIPRMAKVALCGYMAYFLFPSVSLSSGTFLSYANFISADGSFSLEYFLLLVGEGLIGIIIGFFINIIFAAFSTAGQFFSFQMGFSAAEAYDAFSQVENPLMGQFFNLLSMLVFMQNHWFQKLFVGGLTASFKALNAYSIVTNTEGLMHFMLTALTTLFKDALIISLPIMASLFLVNVTMGILTKAAPQMNLMSEGFSLLILMAFFVIMALLPEMCNMFVESFEQGFKVIEQFFIKTSGGGIV